MWTFALDASHVFASDFVQGVRETIGFILVYGAAEAIDGTRCRGRVGAQGTESKEGEGKSGYSVDKEERG